MSRIRLHHSEEACQALPTMRDLLEKRGQHPVDCLNTPLWILCPVLACANWLKLELLKENAPLLNVHFITPPVLRKFLEVALPGRKKTLSSGLSKLLARTFLRASNRPGLAAVPQLLLETTQTLWRAGQPQETTSVGDVGDLCAGFMSQMDQTPYCLSEQIDDALARGPGSQNHSWPGPSYELILYGFGPRQWEEWKLLAATAQMALSADIFLSLPRVVAEKPGLWWLSSWEEIASSEPSADYPSLETFTDESEMERFKQIAEYISSHYPEGAVPTPSEGGLFTGRVSPVIFHASRDQWDEAGIAVSQTLEWLAHSQSPPRIGIVVSNNAALAHEIYSHFQRISIPCRNEYGVARAADCSRLIWGKWLALVAGGLCVSDFTEFYLCTGESLCRVLQVPFARPALVESFLASASCELLTDRLSVICADEPLRVKCPEVLVKFLERWRNDWELAGSIDVRECHERISAMLAFMQELHPDEDFAEKTRTATDFLKTLDHSVMPPIRREDVLSFLADYAMPETEAVEGEVAAQVVITSPERAESQSWDYLFLAGLYEGVWPRAPRAHPIVTDEICERINSSSQRPSRSGQGQYYFPPTSCALLSSQSRRMLDREQFLNLVASARKQIACSTALIDRVNNNQPLSPSEFYQRLFSAVRGGILDGKMLEALRMASTRRMQVYQPYYRPQREVDTRKLREVYDRRRKADLPFDEYFYALNEPPESPVAFSAKDWQAVRQSPAKMWYQWLGLRPGKGEFDPGSLLPVFRGGLYHEWIRQSLESASVPSGTLRKLRGPECGNALPAHTRQTLERLRKAYEQGGSKWPLQLEYELVRLEWAAARTLEFLDGFLNGKYFGTEIKKGSRERQIAVTVQNARLESYGKVDLIVSDTEKPEDAADLIVVDFKTSTSSTSFRKGKNSQLLKSGDYLQVALYGLFYRESQNDGVARWCIYNPFFGMGPENSLLEVTQLAGELFGVLQTVQSKGIFGQLECLDEEYGIAPELPLACLPVEKAVLKSRWEKTFGGDAGQEVDDE